MNEKTLALYEYLVENASSFTSDWQKRQDLKPGSDYSADAPPERAKQVSEQNTLYVKIVAKSLLQTEQEMKESISNWTSQTAAHRVNSKTPLSDVAKNSGIFRRVYWEYIRKFIKETDLEITVDDLLGWEETINYTLDYVMETFTANFMEILLSRLNAQASLIMELSTPVIPLSKEIGLLPIIGDIDTTRAKFILESTLEQSVELKLSHLIIDVSGVVMVDTMVAHQIFKIIDSLGLIGVEATLLGIRPEVAQTAVQLGVNFNKVRTENSLSKVLKKLNYHL